MRLLPVLVLLPFLAGCTDTDWNRLLSFGGSNDADSETTDVATAEPAPAPPPAAAPATAAPTQVAGAQPAGPAPDPFCLGIARQDAMGNDFDPATQQKVAARSYQQCVQIFGSTQ